MAQASAGHKIGQVVGDWWEIDVVLPVLDKVASSLGLHLDNRDKVRSCRGDKVQWLDLEGNAVDYDFVLELEGSSDQLGIPVAFFESFWRRGARHSKDKARDDTNKLLPMRETYPTARYLAIAACGEFTNPAREYVTTRNVDLFYIPKRQIVSAFDACDLKIDYDDKLGEDQKAHIAENLEANFTKTVRSDVADQLIKIAGRATFESFQSKVFGALSALPQEIRIIHCRHSDAVVFENTTDAQDFLLDPTFPSESGNESYIYEVTYSDGFEFARQVESLDQLRDLHQSLDKMVKHLDGLP